MFQDNISWLNEFKKYIPFLEKATYNYFLKYTFDELIDNYPFNDIFTHYKYLEDIKYGINIDINHIYDINNNFLDIYTDIRNNINKLSSIEK